MTSIAENKISAAFQVLNNNKADWLDSIPAGLLKHRGIAIDRDKENDQHNHDQTSGGDTSDCWNWRWITVFSITQKRICSISLKRHKNMYISHLEMTKLSLENDNQLEKYF